MGDLWSSSSVTSTWKPSLLGAVKTNSLQPCWNCKNFRVPEVASPLLGNWNWPLKKNQNIFMASVGQHRAGPPPLGPQTDHTKAIRATPSGITSCLKPNLLKLAEAHSPVVTAWQYRWAICDPQVALPLLGNPACWRRQNQQPPALLKLQNLSFQKEDHPYLVAEIRLKIRARFMASVGHPQVGSPPLGRRTCR